MIEQGDKARDGRADFDFLIGQWNIHHWRLRESQTGAPYWEEFDGTAADYKILAGLGAISEVKLHPASGPVEGLTVRLFDPEARQWSLYWAESVHGTLTTPMIGGVKDGRAECYAHESIGGQHVLSRFVWSNITESSCRWEQAFSSDGSRTWETNWIMELTRRQE